MIRNLFCLLIALVFFIPEIKAENFQLSESSKVSLLTSKPWDKEIYALFGHTAIRVRDSINHVDVAFNYGVFDFNSEDFIYRFVKGETDYMVGVIDFRDYIIEYKLRDVSVTEQILDLTPEDNQKIFDALITNCLPENRIYRYNYFYDNCSTRPRDIVEDNIVGTISYTPTNKSQTYRDLVHDCLNKEPWVRFGIDLVIGADADKEITDRQKDFLPLFLMSAYDNAQIINTDGTKRNLVSSESALITATETTDNTQSANYPLICGLLLLAITITLSIIFYKQKYTVLEKIFDTILFLIAGILGCVIFFLMFFSVHPCTFPNWNIVWLNPLQLIFAFLFFTKGLSKCVYYYHFINFALLTAFLLAWFLIPQSLEMAFIPYILSLWVCSGHNILQYKRSKPKLAQSKS